MSSVEKLLQLPSSFSDGSAECFVPSEYVIHTADELYKRKLANMWMEHKGLAIEGETYKFTRLPTNYQVYIKNRTGTTINDRYLIGNKQGRYDSPNKFFVHFLCLMSGSTTACTCVVCTKARRTQLHRQQNKIKPSASKPAGRQRQATTSGSMDVFTDIRRKRGRDVWDTRDVLGIFEHAHYDTMKNYESFLNQLKATVDATGKQGYYCRDFYRGDEDWVSRITKMIGRQLEKYAEFNTFEPRAGEIVLFYNENLPATWIDTVNQRTLLEGGSEFPPWKAGIVVACASERCEVDDLNDETRNVTPKKLIRVQIFDKDTTTTTSIDTAKCENVSISHTKPLSMFRFILSGWVENQVHPSIIHALTCCTSPLVTAPKHFAGTWPSVVLVTSCMWQRSELYIENDPVRIFLDKGRVGDNIDVMVIQGTHAVLRGSAYGGVSGYIYSNVPHEKTSNVPLSPFETLALPKCMQGSTWYPRADRCCRVITWGCILGRYYSPDAMMQMVGSAEIAFNNRDLPLYFRKSLEKLDELDAPTRWDRVSALGVNFLDGDPVGYARDRYTIKELCKVSDPALGEIDGNIDPRLRSMGSSVENQEDRNSLDAQEYKTDSELGAELFAVVSTDESESEDSEPPVRTKADIMGEEVTGEREAKKPRFKY